MVPVGEIEAPQDETQVAPAETKAPADEKTVESAETKILSVEMKKPARLPKCGKIDLSAETMNQSGETKSPADERLAPPVEIRDSKDETRVLPDAKTVVSAETMVSECET